MRVGVAAASGRARPPREVLDLDFGGHEALIAEATVVAVAAAVGGVAVVAAVVGGVVVVAAAVGVAAAVVGGVVPRGPAPGFVMAVPARGVWGARAAVVPS